MNVYDPSIGNDSGDLLPKQLSGSIPIQPINAMNDLGFGLGKSVSQLFQQIEMLG